MFKAEACEKNKKIRNPLNYVRTVRGTPMHDQNQKTSGVSGALMSMFRIMKLGMTIVYLKFLIERMVSMFILLVHETQLESF